ncbi:MAG TPA: Gfo/Idh/MocA family oxidoreductase, partial [Thermomicrobiales bacterium]|nr:Gfo/Idh/MocA family oxidoreductase [Thermomicrobiales bacterium]
GAFGEAHLETFRGIPGVEVVAVASRSGDRAREIAGRYGIARAFDTYEALCADEAIDAVTVCTEEGAHVAPALAALAAGKHVLVEKPLAATGADARSIAEAARRAPGILMPGHIVRFEARYAHLHERVTRGDLGMLAALHASRNRPRETQGTYARSHPALVTAIHDLDIMLWLMGTMPERVQAWHRLEPGEDGVYGIWGVLHFPGGAIATVEATWMMPSGTGLANGDTFSVVGTRGTAAIDMGAAGMRVLAPGTLSVPDTGYEPPLHGATGGALHAELSHFVQLATGADIAPVVTPQDGVRAVLVAEALVTSAERGKLVPIAD